jgi:hypothetical protein
VQLQKIQNNDSRKFQACLERRIELCIIDSSSLSYFKSENAQKYLDIVCKIIDLKSQRADEQVIELHNRSSRYERDEITTSPTCYAERVA